jgi:hypothetical protein
MMKTIEKRLCFAFFLLIFSHTTSAQLVKKSSSGLCHSPESRWYERTTQYTAFDSLDACMASNGRLPKGMTKTAISKENPSKGRNDYSRAAFGHGWDDADGDCQNSRAEALIATSTTKVRFADAKRCRVVTGRWISPFSSKIIQNASDIDIDHVVPLAWAWHHGANQWPKDKREQFANDPVNLWPVELSLNRSKGAQGPDQWLPPAGQCGYVARFLRIVKQYNLKPSRQEAAWIKAFITQCRS